MIKRSKLKTASQTGRNWRLSLLAISILIALLSVLLLTGCSIKYRIINLNDYIVAQNSGYDGYGSVKLTIDYSKMCSDFKLTSDEIALVDGIVTDYSPITIEHDGDNKLSNSDIIDAKYNTNEYLSNLENIFNAKIRYEKFKYTVKELESLSELDPFENLIVEANNTMTGSGAVELYTTFITQNDDKIVWNVNHSGENGKLSNGDIITLFFENEIDHEMLAREAGIRLTKTETEYELNCFTKPILDEVDIDILEQLGNEQINRVANEWIGAGLNDKNETKRERVLHNYGYILFTNNKDDGSDLLISVYQVETDPVPAGYYTYVGINGKFAYNDYGFYMSDGSELSDSYVDYEKETVRYDRTFGWNEGAEKMGFLYNDVPYAGHEEIDDLIDSVQSQYGEDYENCYKSSYFRYLEELEVNVEELHDNTITEE